MNVRNELIERLLGICLQYSDLCDYMNWRSEYTKALKIYHEVESEKLKQSGENKLIISEKQIYILLELFKAAIEGNLTPYGLEEANKLLKDIENQQSDALKEVK